MTLTVITPPGEEALSLAAAKAFLRVGHDGEDGLIAGLVAGARARIEEASGLALVTRSLRRVFHAWPSAIYRRGIALRPGPVSALTSVRIVHADSEEDDVSDRFTLSGGRLCLKPGAAAPVLATGSRVEVDFNAGYGAAGDIPEDLIHAVKLALLAAYRRDTAAGLPEEAEAILAARREVLL